MHTSGDKSVPCHLTKWGIKMNGNDFSEKIDVEQIQVKDAAKINAHYSPATKVGSAVYISGQLPIDPITREKCTGDMKAQAAVAFNNIDRILKQLGSNRNQLVKTTAYISDIRHWDALNEAYAEFFGEYKPARSIIAVSAIHFDMLVEIEAIAVVE